MKEMRIMRAIGDIDEKYIDEAAPVQEKRKAIRLVPWLRYAAAAACAVLVVGIGIFAVRQSTGMVDDPSAGSSDLVQNVSPFVEFASIEEAEKAVGFDIEIPDSYSAFTERSITVMFGEMIEVQYRDADGNLGLNIRKAGGTDDISGDNNIYENTAEIDVESRSVTLKGNGDKYFLAVWSFEGHSYAVSADQGASQEEFAEIIKEIQ